MKSLILKSAVILTVVVSWSGVPSAELTNATNGTNPPRGAPEDAQRVCSSTDRIEVANLR